ncbi:hypothetical protein KAI68_08050 [bacterium]|nr:hypothetical protein [bacterium]
MQIINKKKLIFILLFLICIPACSRVNTRLFEVNIINPIPESVKNIHIVKDRSSMHGVLYINFEVNRKDLNLIITKNNLKKVNQIPTIIQQVFKNNPWGKTLGTAMKDEIFGKIIRGKYEWHAFYLFVDNNEVYCIKN